MCRTLDGLTSFAPRGREAGAMSSTPGRLGVWPDRARLGRQGLVLTTVTRRSSSAARLSSGADGGLRGGRQYRPGPGRWSSGDEPVRTGARRRADARRPPSAAGLDTLPFYAATPARRAAVWQRLRGVQDVPPLPRPTCPTAGARVHLGARQRAWHVLYLDDRTRPDPACLRGAAALQRRRRASGGGVPLS